MGHSFKDCPLNEKARAVERGKTIPTKATKEPENHTSSEVATATMAKETPKKRGKAPY